MKSKTLQFHSPIPIVQLFVNENIYGKEQKPFEARKDALEWKDMYSDKIYCIDNQFFISESVTDLHDFKKSNLIIIVNTQQEENKVFCVNMPQSFKFYIFRLVLENEQMIVSLDSNDIWFNIPKRESYKLFDFPPKQVIEVRYNAKSDMKSLATLGQRRFKEQYFIFQYLGEFDCCTTLKQGTKQIGVSIPNVEKVINLTKRLW